MRYLPESAQRVLAELEEARHDNIFALLNTIVDPTGEPTEPSYMQEALQHLLAANLVVLSLEDFHPRKVRTLKHAAAMGLVSQLPDWFRFDVSRGVWTLGNGDMRRDPCPAITLTDAGYARSVQILERRGYQWWRTS
jgi:hypothetical protein